VLAFALAVHDGQLWAGTCEPGLNEAGRVYRYGGGSEWIDCGSPNKSNSVTALAAFEGKLYAGTGKYRLRGSALEESANEHPGGRVFRYDDGAWTDCGQLPGVEAVGGMVVFRGRLYASSLYRPAGFFRYEGGSKWTTLGTPDKRVEALGVFDGSLYATSYDGGRVYRFDGEHWTDCGQLGQAADNTQTYSFAVHHGRLFVGTWRTGRVYRFEDLDRWTDVGRLGEELEVMGMLVHNGRLIAGTRPLAEVYSYQGDSSWRRLARLDHTTDVQYRRAWTMAEYQGRLFASTLPSGHVFAFQAGTAVTWDHEFPAGWHHVAAVKSDGRLRLFVDGRAVAQSRQFDPAAYELNHEEPLKIGFGANDHFCGSLAGVRYYGRALADAEIGRLAAEP
jgi:outer membrane protein assembly factor BamB